jgi:osmotically-inducible protein OsmY
MGRLSYRTASRLPNAAHRRPPLPETQADAERLAACIERAVWRETGGSVRDLQVVIHRGGVLLIGHCNTYYTKQKAQHAAMGISAGRELTNRIDVV